MKKIFVSFVLITGAVLSCFSQAPWPSSNWDVATNLTSIMGSNGVEGLSGVHYNPTKKQLFLVQDGGRLRIIQWNEQSGNHLQLMDRNLGGDLEDVTQINDDENEFWVINEDGYKIERFQYSSNYSTFNSLHSWNLLSQAGGMIASSNGGPEGICFVPDSYLEAAGFISSSTGGAYTSQKGMGGLLFLAHQNGGQVWVYDVNKNVSNDFDLVGIYNTKREESCALSFDRSTGLLYILHNIDNNYLEVCTVGSSVVGQNYTLNSLQEFHVSLPTNGGKNMEGIALKPKCEDPLNPTLWMVRDLSGSQSAFAFKQFRPFGLVGACTSELIEAPDFKAMIFPNPSTGMVQVAFEFTSPTEIEVCDLHGKVVFKTLALFGLNTLDLSALSKGFYCVKVDGSFQKLLLH